MPGHWNVIDGDCVEQMAMMDKASVDAVVTDLAAGTAGEHLVCADLLLRGHRAFMADQNCPYDVAVDEGTRLIRVQVKTTRGPRAQPQRVGHYPCYSWQIRRAGKRGRRTYGDDEFDIAAFVALDTREIAYMPLAGCPQTIQIRPTTAPDLGVTLARGDGTCAGCGCLWSERTAGCMSCRSRHWRQGQRDGSQQRGKRFADYPFDRALAALTEGR